MEFYAEIGLHNAGMRRLRGLHNARRPGENFSAVKHESGVVITTPCRWLPVRRDGPPRAR